MSPPPDSSDIPYDHKLKVLIVDDEPTLRLGFAYALTNTSTIVETAANGRQALDRFAEERFDIMILDLRMPEIDGLGVIKALRESGNPIPIVLCSAALTPGAALCAIRHGVVDFLLKPVRPVDLRQVIEFVLHPEKRPLPLAMRAARSGQFDEAIRLLESEPSPSKQATYWLGIFRYVRDSDPNGETPLLTEEIRTSLPILAYNSPTVA